MGPYDSYGNGAAMRVSPCGFAAKTLEEAKRLSRIVTEVTHSHPEGLKGAEAAAVCVFMARERSGLTAMRGTRAQVNPDHADIRDYVDKHYYPMNFTLADIREGYTFDETCQGTVPQAITAFLESEGFKDALRNAISIGGDSDTLAAITGGIAGARYGIPSWERRSLPYYLDDRLMKILAAFEDKYANVVIIHEIGTVASIKIGERLYIDDARFTLENSLFVIRAKLRGWSADHSRRMRALMDGASVEGRGAHGFKEAAVSLTRKIWPGFPNYREVEPAIQALSVAIDLRKFDDAAMRGGE
jgi:hypothetical protein